MNSNNNPLGRLWIFLKDHLGELGYGASTVALGVIGTVLAVANLTGFTRVALMVVIAFLALAAIGFLVIKAKRSTSNSRLQDQISELESVNEELEDNLGNLSAQYQAMFTDLLSTLARRVLNYGMTERISVYRHDPESKSFRMVTRYSENSRFTGPGWRLSYPDDEGVIGEAWTHGICTPGPLPNADENETVYCKETEQRFRIKKEVAKNFRMQSCCYAAFALSHPFGGGRGNVAVVVFESKELGKLGTERLTEEVLGPEGPGGLGPEGERIARFLVSTEAIETRSDLASDEEV